MMIGFFILLFVVALLYSSVGHGGASGYLALMAIFGFAPELMKSSALILNLFVSLTSFLLFFKGGHFNWKLFLPFALTSVPASFWGSTIHIDPVLYKKILGVLLLFPVIRFFFYPNPSAENRKPSNFLLSLVIGASIGFLSGLIGIGGGIILSPILLLLMWSDQKQTAAISALFIFVNSLAGLAGQYSKGIYVDSSMFGFVVVAFTGGLVGAWLGSLKFDQRILKYTLATVLLMASLKLILT